MDLGELLLNMDKTTGMVSVTTRAPLAIHRSTVSISAVEFMKLAHTIGTVMCDQMIEQMAAFQQHASGRPT
jgi:hypothetical protein